VVLALKDPKKNLEFIIKLSKEPVTEIMSLTDTINEYLQLYEKSFFLHKPFIKRDLISVTNLGEHEMVDFLNGIKEKLENISSLALNIKDPNKFSYDTKPEEFKSISQIEKPADKPEPQKTDQELILDKKEEIKEVKEEDPIIEFVYCPECGHKCKGQKGLKVHIYRAHDNLKETILKTVELYKT